jgi:chromosome segregation ATPase
LVAPATNRVVFLAFQATIEERDQLKSTLQETKSKTQSSTTSHSSLVAENRQLRQQAEELARAKSAAQKSASEQAAGLRVKLEQAQVQMREWEAQAARMEAKNDRLQVSGRYACYVRRPF